MNNFNDGRIFFSGFVLGAFTFILLLYMTKPEPQPVAEPVEKHGTFTVVSEYKGCDLVQWQYNMLSEYKYFLHCPK
jgi:hypothetical protein